MGALPFVCGRDSGAHALGKGRTKAFIVRKRLLVYVDLPADTAVLRAVGRDAAEILIIRRTAYVTHPHHLTWFVRFIITDAAADEKSRRQKRPGESLDKAEARRV